VNTGRTTSVKILFERRQGFKSTMKPTGFTGEQPELTGVLTDCPGRSERYEKDLFSKVSSTGVLSVIPPLPVVSDYSGQQCGRRK